MTQSISLVAFIESIQKAREKELQFLKKVAVWKVINTVCGVSTPVLAGGVSFVTHSYIGGTFVASNAFAALSLFNTLRLTMSFFPASVKGLAEMQVSLNRLQDILDMPEIDQISHSHAGVKGVKLQGASFRWSADVTAETVLSDLTISAEAGKVTAMVGTIGSGKTSVFSAIMGEMNTVGSGNIDVNGTLSYVPQQSWITNATLRDNILFGALYDEARYRQTLASCALEDDMRQLPGGDLTEIGERGVNLSGGQKQRVALARSVYNNSDIYLLDDPLGAVDTHVGKILFQQCIKGILRDKAVLLATHQLQYLPDVDYIVVLKGGRIAEEGTYQQLMERKGELFQLVASRAVDEDDSATAVKANSSGAAGRSAEAGKQGDSKKPTLELESSQKNVFKTTTKEDRASGHVQWSVYKRYFSEAGGLPFATLTLLVYSLVQGIRLGVDAWFANWVQVDSTQPEVGDEMRNYYASVYLGMMGAFVVTLCLCGLLFFRSTLLASTKIHNAVFKAVVAAPMSFFDTTPLGRIINRFSNDMNQMDNSLPDTLDNTLYYGTNVVTTLILVIAVFPYFLLVCVPLGFLYYKLQGFFRKSSRDLKRLDGTSRSPIQAHLSATLQGLATIRAYNAQARFEKKTKEYLDVSNSVFWTFTGANRWLGVRLDLLATAIVLFSSLVSVFAPITPSLAGLVMAYVLQLTGQFQWCVRQSVETETKMTSVERLLHYTDIEPEGRTQEAEEELPPPDWPRSGAVEFVDYSLRYRPELPLVLRDVSFRVEDRQKVGVVGRTGASKSTLATALFRIAEAVSGEILLDGVKIATVPLSVLRSKLTIIPQDPVMFVGTIRSNLDPTSLFTDEQLWRTLEQIHFKDAVSAFPEKLEYGVVENGENLSLGQRQMICIARALLRNSRVILMDEATASVDLETDQLIQRAIRESFQDCTVLTIAHRINTIIDADRVLVMEQGQVAEYEAPSVLLGRPESFFSHLVDETGATNAESLRNQAKLHRKA